MSALMIFAMLLGALAYALGVWVLIRCGPYVNEITPVEWALIILWPIVAVVLLIGILAEVAFRFVRLLIRKIVP